MILNPHKTPAKVNEMSISKRVYEYMLDVYWIFSSVLAIYYWTQKDWYHLSITLGTFLIPMLLWYIWDWLKLKSVWQVNALILAFTFIGYSLGSCLDLFARIAWFDKVPHTLSGPFVALLAMMLFYVLKPNHRIERADTPLLITFSFCVSVCVAGLWEIGEIILTPIVGRNLQRVDTGVTDTMQDMIVCTLGTLALMPFIPRFCRGQAGWLTAIIEAFVKTNYPEA